MNFNFWKHIKKEKSISQQCYDKLPWERKAKYIPSDMPPTHKVDDSSDYLSTILLTNMIVQESVAMNNDTILGSNDSGFNGYDGGSGGGGGADSSYSDNSSSNDYSSPSSDSSSQDSGSSYDSGSSFDSSSSF